MKGFLYLLSALTFAGMIHSATAQITEAERKILDSLDSSQTKTTLRYLSEDVVSNRSGAGAGSAISGSEDEKALADAIEKEMRDIGLQVSREPFPVRFYDYGEVSLTAAGRKLPAITLHSSRGTWGSRDGVPYYKGNSEDGQVLEADLVDAGEGLAADYEPLGNVAGKVVLVKRTVWPSLAISEAAAQGAVAAVFFDYPGENPDDALKQDSVQYHDAIPAVSISKQEAALLRDALAAGPVEISLENRVDVSYGFSENVIGSIQGSEIPDEYIAVTAHHDRWFQSAQDDCAGVAVMLQLARVFQQAPPPRRSLLFISFGSEEAGGLATQSDWLTGSYAFVKAHPEITSRLAYTFNVDGAGWTADQGYLFATIDNLSFQRRLLSDLGLAEKIEVRSGVTSWVDAWSLGGIGGGAVSYLLWFDGFTNYQNPGSFSRYYHTQLDVYRPEDYQNLDHDLRLGALGVLRSDQALLLPIDFGEIASWVDSSMAADAAKASDVSFENARSALRDFQAEVMRIERGVAAVDSAPSAKLINRWLMKIRHDLVPWLLRNSTQRAVLKTSPYASELEALAQARTAAAAGDGKAAAAALERVGGMYSGKLVSQEAFLAEYLHGYGPGNWGTDFEQESRSVGPEIYAIHRRLEERANPRAEVPRIRELEARARGHLTESLFIIAGKLEAATRALGETPLP